jgi:SAM-dependent methyltransferase
VIARAKETAWNALVAVRGQWFKRRSFTFGGRTYRYFHHRANMTWVNERAVEMPIFIALLDEAREARGRVLEVGNVTGQYRPHAHDVVDKYERGPGVLNEDVVDYAPAEPYDLIVSISTIEHVGFDEDVKDPEKIGVALRHLASLLKPGGRVVVSLPVGYNPELDERIRAQALPFTEWGYLERTGKWTWEEATLERVAGKAYNTPYEAANGMVIGTIAAPAG